MYLHQFGFLKINKFSDFVEKTWTCSNLIYFDLFPFLLKMLFPQFDTDNYKNLVLLCFISSFGTWSSWYLANNRTIPGSVVTVIRIFCRKIVVYGRSLPAFDRLRLYACRIVLPGRYTLSLKTLLGVISLEKGLGNFSSSPPKTCDPLNNQHQRIWFHVS
jgi:hypothetical protein